jgi:hypothetical protein
VVEVGLCESERPSDTILDLGDVRLLDGRLHWNDWGWGHSDGNWQAHERGDGQHVPRDSVIEACLSV